MSNTNFWLIVYTIAGLDFTFVSVWILKMLLYYYKEKAVHDVYYSLCCFFILHRFTCWIRLCVCEHVWKREPRNVSWLSACDIRHCVSPLPTFPHTYTQAAAPRVIHHLSEKIEEGLLWSFLMEKKASKPPSPPPSPFSFRPRAGEFSLSFSPSVLLLPLFSSRLFLCAFMFSSLRADWSASRLPLIKGHFLHHRNPIHSPLAHSASD